MFLGTTRKIYRERIHGFGEAFGQILVLFIFLVAGAILVPLSWPHWDWTALVYAVLSLTVIRMIPVALSLWGAGLDKGTVAFLGWFGPRGIASILYLLMAVLQIGAEGHRRVFSVITLTVLLSIFLHGMSAVPFSRMFPEEKPNPNS
jgi:NhaP-type Na+/H+ or K+/H+ antiporter